MAHLLRPRQSLWPRTGRCGRAGIWGQRGHKELPLRRLNSTHQSNRGSVRLKQEVAHYLATGEADPLGRTFPGEDTLERLRGYKRYLRSALIEEVRCREHGRRQRHAPADFDPASWTRRKVEPMITGLFPLAERQVMLDVAERSLVFLTRQAAHQAIRDIGFLEDAWMIANIYLGSLGAATFGGEGDRAVGLSLETKCYVSLEYFAEEAPLADYVVHEVAHIFHNCKRRTVGLPHSHHKEWLLDVAFVKRKTFAYACEAYSRLVERARPRQGRRLLLAQGSRASKLCDDFTDRAELLDILADAIDVRNGWRRILVRCSPPKRTSTY